MIPLPGCPLWLPDLPGPAGASAMPAVNYTTSWGTIDAWIQTWIRHGSAVKVDGKASGPSRKTVLVAGGAGSIGPHACKGVAKANYLPIRHDNHRSEPVPIPDPYLFCRARFAGCVSIPFPGSEGLPSRLKRKNSGLIRHKRRHVRLVEVFALTGGAMATGKVKRPAYCRALPLG